MFSPLMKRIWVKVMHPYQSQATQVPQHTEVCVYVAVRVEAVQGELLQVRAARRDVGQRAHFVALQQA